MGSSLIIRLMLLMLYGCNAAGEREEDLSVSNSSSYGCSYCCSRIDNQTTVLNRISNASDELVGDVGKIKTGVLEDLPSQLERQTAVLDAYDARFKEQELLLVDLNRLVKGKLCCIKFQSITSFLPLVTPAFKRLLEDRCNLPNLPAAVKFTVYIKLFIF